MSLRNRIFAGSAIAVFAYAFVLIFARGADAHEVEAIGDPRCSGDELVMVVEWRNGHDVAAVVEVSDGRTLVLPPNGSVKAEFKSSITWKVIWSNGFFRDGETKLDPSFEGCLPPVVTATTVLPQVTVPTLTSTTTTSTPAEVISTTKIAESSVATPVEVDRIRFTG